VVSANAQNTDALLALGATLTRQNRLPEALDVLRRGQKVAPDNPRTNLQLAVALEAMGQKSEAVPYYQTVLRRDPENMIALNNLAFALAEEDRELDQALTFAQRAKQRAPNNDDVSDTLAWVYIRKRLNDNAILILKDLTGKQPKNPTYQFHMGVALAQKGNRPAARQSFENALKLNPAPAEAAKIRQYMAKLG
jgi:Flp pilus assembly protein TadD